jgi:hypothetical protein
MVVSGAKADGLGDYSWWGGTSASAKLRQEWSGGSCQVYFGSNCYGEETHILI